ncbi:hypothetical protein OGY87_04130 [Citrobacter sp. Cy234]|uniref:hypothetical protein n=1 Tax=Citrobacter sp. Cy234 TaxID=2985165 RepID=UPI00257538CC|nr:hypothetical protein [Citrobacter sp. Cy234]MDM2725032.1 hypothetical protein [Citrobacter sp. Cy234]
MTILIKTLKIMASGVVFVSGITTATSTVYFLPEAKSAGVASSDKNALMFLGMDRDVNLKVDMLRDDKAILINRSAGRYHCYN